MHRHHSILVCLTCCLSYLLVPAGRADIAVIVNKTNTESSLTEQQLKRIFLGRLPLYPETRREILAIDLPEDSPAFVTFYNNVVEMEGDKLKRYRAYYLFSGRGKLPLSVTSATEMVKKVAEDPAAIGYVDCNALTEDVRVLMVLPEENQATY